MNQQRRREGVLIEPYKQLRFGITFLLINLIFSALIVGIFGYFVYDIYQAQSVYFQLNDQQAAEILSKLGKPVVLGIGLVLSFIITTLLLSARYTHQFYGPLVSIRRFLDEIKEGKSPSAIQLRSSDQLYDLADRLNNLSSKVYSEKSLNEIERWAKSTAEGESAQTLKIEGGDPFHNLSIYLNKISDNLKKS